MPPQWRVPKESHELLREVFRDHGPKEIAAALGLSLSLVYKWAEDPEGSGSASPLERVGRLIRETRDPRLVQWLCQQADGYFVRNPQSYRDQDYEVIPATHEIVQQFADLLAVISQAALDQVITLGESADIREVWERLKCYTEGFVQCCEDGDFSGIKPSAPAGAASKPGSVQPDTAAGIAASPRV